MISHQIIILLEDRRSPEFERTVSKPIDPLVVVVNVETDRNNIEGFDGEVVNELPLWWVSVGPPQCSNHAVEIHLPGAGEGNSNIEKIPPTHV